MRTTTTTQGLPLDIVSVRGASPAVSLTDPTPPFPHPMAGISRKAIPDALARKDVLRSLHLPVINVRVGVLWVALCGG